MGEGQRGKNYGSWVMLVLFAFMLWLVFPSSLLLLFVLGIVGAGTLGVGLFLSSSRPSPAFHEYRELSRLRLDE